MSKNKLSADPALYPESSVLINKFDIRDQDSLQQMEGFIFGIKTLEPLPLGNFDYDHLKSIHKHFFADVYSWAGQERTIDIAKGDCYFGHKQYITNELNKLFKKLQADNLLSNCPQEEFCKKLSYYFNEINAAHPFREGNGRTQRAFCDLLAQQSDYHINWNKMDQDEYMQASISGFLQGDYIAMENIFKKIITQLHKVHKIDDISISTKTTELLKLYVKKQLQLTECLHQKNQLLLENSPHLQNTRDALLKINRELQSTAKELIATSEGQILLKQPPVTLQKQGGFSAIFGRIEQDSISIPDALAIFYYARNTATITPQLTQKQDAYSTSRSL